MRLVLDTSILVAAMRSPGGASRELVERGLNGEFDWLLSASLLLEYESVLLRPQHLQAAKMKAEDVDLFLRRILRGGTRIVVGPHTPLQMPDLNDRHIVALALSGAANMLITHNVRHFAFLVDISGVKLLLPGQMLGLLGEFDE